jgi:hypothetical protein
MTITRYLTEDMIFPRNLLDAVISSLLAMTDAEVLKQITDMAGWLYWVYYGKMLAKRVVELHKQSWCSKLYFLGP